MVRGKKPLDKETVQQVARALEYYIGKYGSLPIPIPPAKAVTDSQSLLSELKRWLES